MACVDYASGCFFHIREYLAGVRLPAAVACLAFGTLSGITACCLPARPIEAARVLKDVVAAEERAERERRTPPVHLRVVEYHAGNRYHRGDLYSADRSPRAGLVLVPGAAEKGKDDPRLVAFAESLARARFTVLVPDLVNVRNLQVGPRDIRDIADAFAYLMSQPELTSGGFAGIAAASYAVGPAVLAALEPDIREHVRFVLGIGGYYNLDDLIVFFTTGWFRDATRPGSNWRHLTPHDYGKWVFLRANVGRIKNPSDRHLLQRVANEKIDNPDADVRDLVQRLGPEGEACYQLLINKDLGRVNGLKERLPPAIRRDLAALNVASHDVAKLRARLILVHGRDDRMIPYTESKALAAVAPRARLFLLDGLAHVDVSDKVSLRDAMQIWCAIDSLLAERR